MCRKFLILVCLITTTIFILIVFKTNVPETRLVDRVHELKQSRVDAGIVNLIQEINDYNNSITSLYCDIEFITWEKLLKIKLNGFLKYKKEKYFRIKLNSLFGNELDLGSNKKIFWYWSKRDKEPNVYWSNYEDFYKTRLKNPFNPMFLRATLGLEIIDLSDAKVYENKKDIFVNYERINSYGQNIIFCIVVNKKEKQIDGFLICDLKGNVLASCEIQQRKYNIPSKILYNWSEEGKTMIINIKSSSTNQKFTEEDFEIPNLGKKINMSHE